MASLGAQLKLAREKRGVTLEDISSSTKIGTRMLRAIEADHYDQLPGGIFNKGFVRAFARAIRVDEEKAIEDYLAATEPAQPDAKADLSCGRESSCERSPKRAVPAICLGMAGSGADPAGARFCRMGTLDTRRAQGAAAQQSGAASSSICRPRRPRKLRRILPRS